LFLGVLVVSVRPTLAESSWVKHSSIWRSEDTPKSKIVDAANLRHPLPIENISVVDTAIDTKGRIAALQVSKLVGCQRPRFKENGDVILVAGSTHRAPVKHPSFRCVGWYGFELQHSLNHRNDAASEALPYDPSWRIPSNFNEVVDSRRVSGLLGIIERRAWITSAISKYPSPFCVAIRGDLSEKAEKQQDCENGNYQSRARIQSVHPIVRFFGSLLCLGLMCFFANYAVEGLLQYYGLTAISSFLGFVSLEALSLGGLIWFGLAPCCFGLICEPCQQQTNNGQPCHDGTIVLQKCLTHLYYCSTVMDMANVLNPDKQIAVIGALAEGSSIRSIERITGVHRDTIMRLGVKVGQGCAKLLDSSMRDLPCNRLEMDEIWGFVGKKERNVREGEDGVGSIWTFCAIDAETKLVPSFKCGKRDAATAKAFVQDVANRMAYRVQISTDGLNAYVAAMESAYGEFVDYGQIIKTYGHEEASDNRRYSAPKFVSSEKKIIVGNPDERLISTSYVERLNATTRLHMRRLTRLTLAFSKKRENFEAAVALHFAYYNFVKRHSTVRCTPAMAAGIVPSFWSVGDLLEAAA
jgi:IS1 family transposase